MVEPSGTSWGYYGCAVGKGKQAARAEIEKLKLEAGTMTCAELVKEAAKIIYGVHDDVKDKHFVSTSYLQCFLLCTYNDHI